jgi:anti-sigma regulatory factor (Ser/Thr protein kinase)
MDPTLTLELKPDWEQIESVREQSARFLQERGHSEDTVNAVSMVAAELTENAVHYGVYERPEQRIAVSVAIERDSITVEVKSPAKATGEDLEKLDRMIQWIRGYQDPYEAYLSRLKEVSSQSTDSPESGLGLVRIAYEGQSVLDFYVDDQNIVSVSAIHTLEKQQAGQ